MTYKVVTFAMSTIVILITVDVGQGQKSDYSDPIKCFYCFGSASNSSCADPVPPKSDKEKALQVIECEHGICLKWTYLYNNTMFMHRTCSEKLTEFNIKKIDGVCRSERNGIGYLCMCGKHLCNTTEKLHYKHCSIFLLCLHVLTRLLFGDHMS